MRFRRHSASLAAEEGIHHRFMNITFAAVMSVAVHPEETTKITRAKNGDWIGEDDVIAAKETHLWPLKTLPGHLLSHEQVPPRYLFIPGARDPPQICPCFHQLQTWHFFPAPRPEPPSFAHILSLTLYWMTNTHLVDHAIPGRYSLGPFYSTISLVLIPLMSVPTRRS